MYVIVTIYLWYVKDTGLKSQPIKPTTAIHLLGPFKTREDAAQHMGNSDHGEIEFLVKMEQPK